MPLATRFQQKEGLSFHDAFEALSGDRFPAISEAERAKRKAEGEQARAAAIADARPLEHDRLACGYAGRSLSPVARITAALPPSIRFGRVPLRRDPDTRDWREPMPALVGAITMADELVAIQRIFLRDDASDKGWRKPRKSKYSLAPARWRAAPRPWHRRLRGHPARVLFDQLVIDINPDGGPLWPDRLIARGGNGDDWERLVTALEALAECAGVRSLAAECA